MKKKDRTETDINHFGNFKNYKRGTKYHQHTTKLLLTLSYFSHANINENSLKSDTFLTSYCPFQMNHKS